jgi:predicted DNA-binding protein
MAGMVKRKQVLVRMSREQYARVKWAAKCMGVTPTEYVRKCVELGDLMNANKDRIAEMRDALKKAIAETIDREMLVAREKTA